MSADNGIALRPEAERVERIRALLAKSRTRTGNALVEVGTELAVKTDWRIWYHARPFEFLAAAFFAGFLLAKRR